MQQSTTIKNELDKLTFDEGGVVLEGLGRVPCWVSWDEVQRIVVVTDFERWVIECPER